ncbi:MAG: hypothetical protein Q4P71_09350 [Actinomycetaceae bacterium]|nr:hypothetical protein [Actinomycetaceae bacterium]
MNSIPSFLRRALVFLSGAGLTMTTLVPTIAQADDLNPDLPTSPCAQFVEVAPIISGDLTDSREPIVPVPTDDGHVTPVILVHGWTSGGLHSETRNSPFSHLVDLEANGRGGELLARVEITSSLIGKLQQVPGAAVYLYDYQQVSSRWVTDPQIGQRLAGAIECLTDFYANEAVVIGHSMGGLALREAMAHNDAAGFPVSKRVSQAITFGTPNEGTEILDFAHRAIDSSMMVPGLNIPVGIVKLLLSECSKKADATGEYCLGLRGAGGAFYSEGAQAMLPGSAELTQLPPWPDNVNYVALAGHIEIGGFTLFGHSSGRLLDLGDLAVDYDSALAGAQHSTTASCEYGIVSSASANDLGLRIKALFSPDASEHRRPTGLLTPTIDDRTIMSPCYHSNLMSEVTLVNTAVTVTQQAALTARPLITEPEPSPTAPTDPTPEPSIEPSQITTPTPTPAPSSTP